MLIDEYTFLSFFWYLFSDFVYIYNTILLHIGIYRPYSLFLQWTQDFGKERGTGGGGSNSLYIQ